MIATGHQRRHDEEMQGVTLDEILTHSYTT